MKSEKKNNGVFNLFSFIVLMIASTLIVTNNLLPIIGIGINGPLFNILETIKDVLLLVMVAILSYNFIIGKGKVIAVFYWVAVVIFLAGIVLRWFI